MTADGWQAVEWSCLSSAGVSGWIISRNSPLLPKQDDVFVLESAARMTVIPYVKGSQFSIVSVIDWSDYGMEVEVR